MNTILCALIIPIAVALIAVAVHHGDRVTSLFEAWLDEFCRRLTSSSRVT